MQAVFRIIKRRSILHHNNSSSITENSLQLVLLRGGVGGRGGQVYDIADKYLRGIGLQSSGYGKIRGASIG